MWRISKASSGGFAFLVFLFVILPFLNVYSAIDPDLNPRLIAISAFCAFGILALSRNSIMIPAEFKSIGIASLGILMVSLIAVISSINTGEALAEWFRIFIIYFFAIIAILIIRKSNIETRIILRFVSFSTLIFCGYAIAQTVPIVDAILNHKEFRISSDLASTLSNKNFFSEVLTLLIPSTFLGLFQDERRFKALHFVAFLMCTLYIFLLSSLSCWIAISVSLLIVVVVFLFNSSTGIRAIKKSSVLGFTFSILLLFSILAFVLVKFPIGKNLLFKFHSISNYISDPALLDQNINSNNNSIFDRLLMIRNSVRMIGDHPIFGAGLNNWKLLYTSYGVGGTEVINSGAMNFEHPHNDYLLIFSEQGVFGLIAYLLFFFFVFKAWKRKWKDANGESRSFLIVILFSVVAFMIMSCFSYPRSRIYTPILLMFYISLLFMKQEKEENEIIIKPLYGILAGVICLVGVFVASIRLNSEIHAKKMMIAKMQKNFARVIRESEKIDPLFYPMEINSTSIAWYRGMAFFYSGQVQAALTEYRKAILITPNHLRTINDLATAFEQTGQPDIAIFYYKKALQISPDLTDSRFNCSATYFNQNKVDSAYQILSFLSYYNLSIGPQENYVKFMSAILAARISDSLKISKDTVLIDKMNTFINDIPATKKYIRNYTGKAIWPDVFSDTK